MNPLVPYIEKELHKGFSEELIQKKLEQAKYTKEEIKNAFQEYSQQHHYKRYIEKIVEQETKHKWLFAVLAIFAIILLTAFLVTLFLIIDWNTAWENAFPHETVQKEPTAEIDCQEYTHREKERCLLKVAALYDDVSFCVNLTSKVMKYECNTVVWKKNYCNYLILTNQSMENC